MHPSVKVDFRNHHKYYVQVHPRDHQKIAHMYTKPSIYALVMFFLLSHGFLLLTGFADHEVQESHLDVDELTNLVRIDPLGATQLIADLVLACLPPRPLPHLDEIIMLCVGWRELRPGSHGPVLTKKGDRRRKTKEGLY